MQALQHIIWHDIPSVTQHKYVKGPLTLAGDEMRLYDQAASVWELTVDNPPGDLGHSALVSSGELANTSPQSPEEPLDPSEEWLCRPLLEVFTLSTIDLYRFTCVRIHIIANASAYTTDQGSGARLQPILIPCI